MGGGSKWEEARRGEGRDESSGQTPHGWQARMRELMLDSPKETLGKENRGEENSRCSAGEGSGSSN